MKKLIIAISSLALACGLCAKTLKIEVPPANLVGTPVPIKMTNLEPKAPNPEIEVPDDVTNVALKKPVTSSDDFPLIGELEYVTDGDKTAAEGTAVELMNGLQWVQIDLEKECEIYAIAMWHFHQQERVYHDVIVQVSNDPEFLSGVTTVYNNDFDNSAKKGKGENLPYIETNNGKVIVVNPAVKGRYVRLFTNGNTTNDMNHYTEVEVYGK